jgi:DNA-binding PadR family transcriptional regulator
MDDPRRFLPLTPAVFHVLLALSDGDRHGYGIIQDVPRAPPGELKLPTRTRYTIINRLVEERQILESAARPDAAEDDERRRYYGLTPLGRAVVQAESRRLERMVALARTRRMLPKNARASDR